MGSTGMHKHTTTASSRRCAFSSNNRNLPATAAQTSSGLEHNVTTNTARPSLYRYYTTGAGACNGIVTSNNIHCVARVGGSTSHDCNVAIGLPSGQGNRSRGGSHSTSSTGRNGTCACFDICTARSSKLELRVRGHMYITGSCTSPSRHCD